MADQKTDLINEGMLAAYHDELMNEVIVPLQTMSQHVEGYIRVAGSSDPALSYKHYDMGEFGSAEWTGVFYPCLIGTKLSGDDAQVGKILHVLQKLGAFTENGVAKWRDIKGVAHLIDGSEGDVHVVNIHPIYEVAGQYVFEGTKYDVFLRGLAPFTYKGIKSTEIPVSGDSPDYAVLHNDGGVNRMHSCYNPAWNGSYSAPYGVVGRYVATDNDGEVIETYDANATMLGGAGGLHSTDITLFAGEQYAMNQNPDTTKPVPFYNHHANRAEHLWAGLACEGGTFDSHKSQLFGSGFTSNDMANEDTYGAGGEARNGLRVFDKDGNPKYFAFSGNVRFLTGLTEGTQYGAFCVNSWRSPWHCLEAYRVICYAIQNGVPELTWFAFEGCKYKWRSVPGYAGPLQGEATCVVFKMMSAQAHANAVDPTDGITSIAGHRVDVVVSAGMWHGRLTQCSPLYWTSGLIFTQDEDGKYECYMQRDQSKLIISENGEIAATSHFNFEQQYEHVMSLPLVDGYRKNYNNKALMLPDVAENAAGAGLHTYVGGYNYYRGAKAAAGKKVVRGFRRGYDANSSLVSPLCVFANVAPSNSSSVIAFGTCVQVVSES